MLVAFRYLERLWIWGLIKVCSENHFDNPHKAAHLRRIKHMILQTYDLRRGFLHMTEAVYDMNEIAYPLLDCETGSIDCLSHEYLHHFRVVISLTFNRLRLLELYTFLVTTDLFSWLGKEPYKGLTGFAGNVTIRPALIADATAATADNLAEGDEHVTLLTNSTRENRGTVLQLSKQFCVESVQDLIDERKEAEKMMEARQDL